ncbi:endoplasmic reticulum metallopeptidase 1 [Tothia fuscella]|uniref:Peptide hydrolase n=1 Tax=Tothia fuscella TaxID=1048955 RepID=A0A9P4NJH9_9PEZI|nr:endoplasmic reticulum metallopeptidase 1 [Tothia fuscella]
MAKRQPRNPLAFTPGPVTFFTTLILAALFTSLVIVHHVVPPAPKSPTPLPGINITEAWLDLQQLSNGYHPYNSHRNNQVRNWLLQRIDDILKRNGVRDYTGAAKDGPVKVYNDMNSSLMFGSPDSALAVAFAGENIMVYIRGSEDDEGYWWENPKIVDGRGGVLVNAHFDSVPSGYGATDDGVGVVSILQLISYFTRSENAPKRGLVALLNNGEEDYLNGAYAFTQHPLSKFPHTFLNLEGAGAGGRATLFRSTDNEVTKFYRNAPNPFGTVVSADGFKQGLVRSQTDYVIFNGELGMRGLDVAFMEPRARYHTIEDSTRYTGKDSLWHMLGASIATLQGLTSDTSDTFNGDVTVEGGVSSGRGADTVWFDLFGRVFAVFELNILFAISVSLLVVTPLTLIALHIILVKTDKWYPFARKGYLRSSEDDDYVSFNGWRGLFRTPVAVVLATAATIGLGFLVAKLNPYIVYSSEYSVWSMMLTTWLVIAWFILRGADNMRPSALQRPFSLLWLYIGAYILLVGVTISEQHFKLAGEYFMVFYFAAIFLALLISYLEFFALPKKAGYVQQVSSNGTHGSTPQYGQSPAGSRPITASHEERSDDEDERTSLLRGNRSTFSAGYGSRARSGDGATDNDVHIALPITLYTPFEEEQGWSGSLPRWTWLLQFLLLSIIPITLIGQVALIMTSALYQTPSDGSPVLMIYLFIAVLSLLLLAPTVPFIHRFHYPIPTLLFLIAIATTVYNLLAFPFSPNNKLKVYFLQEVDLESGITTVSLTGLMPYVHDIIKAIPSSTGQNINCTSPDYSARSGLTKCKWSGLPPDVRNGKGVPKGVSPEMGYKNWVSFNVTRSRNASEAVFHVSGKQTRACRLLFESDISDYNVTGFGTDPRFPRVQKKGCRSIRLWNRQWGDSWTVKVRWDNNREKEGGGSGGRTNNGSVGVGNGLDGRIVCLWSDANDPGTIPAYTEVLRYMPTWSGVTKLSDGLVEGGKVFKV